MDNILKQKQIVRFDFLHELYEMTSGISSKKIDISRVIKKLELKENDGLSAIDWLKGERLIQDPKEIRMDPIDYIQITHSGIKEIESALSSPKEATKYFAPVNSLHQHITINNSTGVQLGDHNSQTTNVVTQDNRQLFQNMVTATNNEILDNKEKEFKLDARID